MDFPCIITLKLSNYLDNVNQILLITAIKKLAFENLLYYIFLIDIALLARYNRYYQFTLPLIIILEYTINSFPAFTDYIYINTLIKFCSVYQ